MCGTGTSQCGGRIRRAGQPGSVRGEHGGRGLVGRSGRQRDGSAHVVVARQRADDARPRVARAPVMVDRGHPGRRKRASRADGQHHVRCGGSGPQCQEGRVDRTLGLAQGGDRQRSSWRQGGQHRRHTDHIGLGPDDLDPALGDQPQQQRPVLRECVPVGLQELDGRHREPVGGIGQSQVQVCSEHRERRVTRHVSDEVHCPSRRAHYQRERARVLAGGRPHDGLSGHHRAGRVLGDVDRDLVAERARHSRSAVPR